VSGIELDTTGEMWPQNLTQTGRREVLHLLRSHDLSVSALFIPMRRSLDNPEHLEARLEQIRLTMALAYDLGPRLVIIQPGKLPAQEKEITPQAQLMRESLEALGKHGDRIGVKVALDGGLDEPATMAAYLDRLDVGSLAVNYNPANYALNGFNAYDAVRTLGRRIANVHAQDMRRINPSRLASAPLGHGDIDWMQLLANFEEVEYRAYMTVVADNRVEAEAGIDFLRRVVK
jgi:sugar phosphate isomerase/epimerase